MAVRKIRPRFSLAVPLSAAEVVARLDARMNRPDSPCGGVVAGHGKVEGWRGAP